MPGHFNRLAKRWSWFRPGFSKARRATRTEIGCESMETRALMASNTLSNLLPLAQPSTIGVVSATQAGPQSTQSEIVSTATNPKLVAALEQFLGDFEAALNHPGATLGSTLQADLNQIALLAGTNDTRAVQRLTSDVTSIVASGTISSPQRLTLISDLESVVLGAGVPGSVVVSAANQALSPSQVGGLLGTESSSALADPNALGTPAAGSTRGQSYSADIAAVPIGISSGDPATNSGLLGRSFRTLMDDLRAFLARSPSVSQAQKRAVQSDFAAIAFSSHRPAANAASALTQDLNAIVMDGQITNDGRLKIAQDLSSLLNNAGVPPRLIDRTLADLGPVIRAEDLTPGDLKVLLGDLINLLLARPAAGAGAGG